MVKKAKWLENVKKAFSPDVKKLKHQAEEEETEISYPVLITRSRSSPPQFEVRVDEVNYEHKKKIKHLSHPPSEAEEDDDALEEDSTPSSPEFVPPPSAGKSKEDAAAVFIQSTFRRHLARKEAKRMKRLARLKLFMEGSVVQRQAAHTIKSMQAYTCVQSQIYSRRIRMSNENKARHKHLYQKHSKEIGGSKNGGGKRNLSNQSKKKVEAGLLNSEATMRRDKALASASTHLQHLKPTNTTMFIDPNNLTWGWSWSERWTAEQPGENSEKEQTSTVKPSVKTSTNNNSHGGETAKSTIRKNLPNTPSTSSSSTTRKNKPTPPSIRPKTTDAIAKSSEKNSSRHSIARSSVSDDEGLASSAARLRNMVPTKLADEIAKSSEKNRRHNIARSSVSDDEGMLASSAARHRNMVPTKPSDEIAKNSEKNLRHSIARSSISDDEGLASSLARRRNMVPSKPPRGGKIKAQSSSSVAAAAATTEEEGNGVLQEKAPAMKRASPAPKPRRSPAPAKVENNVLKAVKTSV